MIDLTPEVLAWVERAMSPTMVCVGEFSAILPVSVSLQPAPTQPCIRKYLSGGGVYQYGYELYLKCRPEDETGRIKAIHDLSKVAQLVDAQDFPEAPAGVVYISQEVTARPNKLSSDKDGTEIYQMIATITYIERT